MAWLMLALLCRMEQGEIKKYVLGLTKFIGLEGSMPRGISTPLQIYKLPKQCSQDIQDNVLYLLQSRHV